MEMGRSRHIQGSIVALITPIDAKGCIDERALRELVRDHIEAKTDGLVIAGTTGEGALLSLEEKVRLFAIVSEASGDAITLIANVGTCQTDESVLLARESVALGFHAGLVITPYYVRPTFEGLCKHLASVGSTGLPLLLYHHPKRTGVQLSIDNLRMLSQEMELVGIKESSGDLSLAAEIIHTLQIPLFSGDDPLVLSHIALGAVGAISVTGNVVLHLWNQMVRAALQDEMGVAKKLFSKIYPLCRAIMQETNPQGVKYAMSLLGKCECVYRLPLVSPQEKTQKQIVLALDKLVRREP